MTGRGFREANTFLVAVKSTVAQNELIYAHAGAEFEEN